MLMLPHSEPVDVSETRQSRSPLISVYLKKTKPNLILSTSNSTANKSEEILVAPISEEKPEIPRASGIRDEISRPNYAYIMRPQYYGSMLPEMEQNLAKEEEDNRFFNLAALMSPPRKPYVAGNMRPYSRPQQNYANYMGPRPYGYPSGYGMQAGYVPQRFTGYVPQRFTGYAPQTGYGVIQPDDGYRLGNGPDMSEENPDEEEDNKFFNLSELLSPPRKPYVPGTIRPNSSPRPNYANFLGPNFGRPSYGQMPDPYSSGYSGNFNGYTDIYNKK